MYSGIVLSPNSIFSRPLIGQHRSHDQLVMWTLLANERPENLSTQFLLCLIFVGLQNIGLNIRQQKNVSQKYITSQKKLSANKIVCRLSLFITPFLTLFQHFSHICFHTFLTHLNVFKTFFSHYLKLFSTVEWKK